MYYVFEGDRRSIIAGPFETISQASQYLDQLKVGDENRYFECVVLTLGEFQ